MHSMFTPALAQHLHVLVLKAILTPEMVIQVDGILALQELVRRAQVEEQRQAMEQAMEQATRRALGE